jgi:site-specific recombinase XerD
LRHSFASFGVAAGLSLPQIGGLLGHKSPATTAKYAHLDEDVLRKAADRIGDYINKNGKPKVE